MLVMKIHEICLTLFILSQTSSAQDGGFWWSGRNTKHQTETEINLESMFGRRHDRKIKFVEYKVMTSTTPLPASSPELIFEKNEKGTSVRVSTVTKGYSEDFTYPDDYRLETNPQEEYDETYQKEMSTPKPSTNINFMEQPKAQNMNTKNPHERFTNLPKSINIQPSEPRDNISYMQNIPKSQRMEDVSKERFAGYDASWANIPNPATHDSSPELHVSHTQVQKPNIQVSSYPGFSEFGMQSRANFGDSSSNMQSDDFPARKPDRRTFDYFTSNYTTANSESQAPIHPTNIIDKLMHNYNPARRYAYDHFNSSSISGVQPYGHREEKLNSPAYSIPNSRPYVRIMVNGQYPNKELDTIQEFYNYPIFQSPMGVRFIQSSASQPQYNSGSHDPHIHNIGGSISTRIITDQTKKSFEDSYSSPNLHYKSENSDVDSHPPVESPLCPEEEHPRAHPHHNRRHHPRGRQKHHMCHPRHNFRTTAHQNRYMTTPMPIKNRQRNSNSNRSKGPDKHAVDQFNKRVTPSKPNVQTTTEMFPSSTQLHTPNNKKGETPVNPSNGTKYDGDYADVFEAEVNTKNEDDDCICVNYFLCNDGIISTDGRGILDLRFNSCPNDNEVCCKLLKTTAAPEENNSEKYIRNNVKPDNVNDTLYNLFSEVWPEQKNVDAEIKTSTVETPVEDDGCICVPYFLCDDGVVQKDGKGLLDLRFSSCSDELEVCCKLPKNTTNPNEFNINRNITDVVVDKEKKDDSFDGDSIEEESWEVEPEVRTPEDDCVCVHYFLCDDGNKIITNGKGLLDLRFTSCPGDQVCCKLPKNDTNTEVIDSDDQARNVTTASNIQAVQSRIDGNEGKMDDSDKMEEKKDNGGDEEDGCVCVYDYLCADGTINVDGKGLLDLRFSSCPEDDQVCCKKLI